MPQKEKTMVRKLFRTRFQKQKTKHKMVIKLGLNFLKCSFVWMIEKESLKNSMISIYEILRECNAI